MRSDAIDQWLSSYLEMPVKLSFEGSVGDALRGTFCLLYTSDAADD